MKKNRIIGLGALGLFLLVTILFYYFDGARFFSLTSLQKYSADLLAIVNQYYFLSVFLFSIFFIVAISFSLPVTGPLTLLSGFLFGMLRGFLLSTASATIGATLAFLFLRKNLNDVMRTRHGKRLEKFKKKIEQYGVFYVLILHFTTVVPFAFVNILAALAGLSVVTVAWTSAVGFIPLALIYTAAGSKLAAINSINDIFSYNVMIMFALLMAVMIFPLIIKRLMRGKIL